MDWIVCGGTGLGGHYYVDILVKVLPAIIHTYNGYGKLAEMNISFTDSCKIHHKKDAVVD
jgi:hypothetical protein